MKTTVINIFGGPGSGKSTLAAGVYYHLKKAHKPAELVREYVKKWAWEGVLPNRLDQLYITGKQSKAEHMLYGKVPTIITDCPLLMGVFYDQKYNQMRTVEKAVETFLESTPDVRRLNFFTERTKEYDESGRYCSKKNALETDVELMEFLIERGVEVTQLQGTPEEQVSQILDALELTEITWEMN